MRKTKLKTLEYRRVIWSSDDKDLEAIVKSAWPERGRERQIKYKDDSIVSGLSYHNFPGVGIGIHCAKYVDDQSIGTVPKQDSAVIKLGEASPPADANFLSSAFAALICRNHVICLDCGRNASQLHFFLVELIKKTMNDADLTHFAIRRVANIDRIQQIKKYGVKQVDFSYSISDIAFSKNNAKKSGNKLLTGLCDYLAAVGMTDYFELFQTAKESMMTLSLKAKKNELTIMKPSLDAFALKLTKDDEHEDYCIVLNNDDVLRPDQITLSKKTSIDVNANSISIEYAFLEMIDYHSQLLSAGLIDI